MDTLNTIIFDIGLVLVDLKPRYLFVDKMRLSEETCAYLIAHCFNEDWRQAHDLGRPFDQGIDLLLKREARIYHEAITAYRTCWADMIKPIEGTIEILRELKENGHLLYAASNWSAATFPILLDKMPFLQIFENIQISGDIGIAKPNPAFFQKMLTDFCIDPTQAIFIDDSSENIQGAQSCAISSILYENPAQLRSKLIQRSINLRPEPHIKEWHTQVEP